MNNKSQGKNLELAACSLRPKKGFTLLEILVVIMIMGFLTAMVAGHFSRIKGEAAIVTALNEMKDIKEAIRDRFYPDLGLIPEDVANPEWATRFLCLNKDCTDADIQAATACSDFGGECEKMCDFLEVRLGSFTQAQRFLQWDKYSRKGWHGLYMEQDAIYDADGLGAGTVYLPVLTDAWRKIIPHADEDPGNPDDDDGVLGEYRIIYDELDGTSGITREDERLSVRIVSFGANGVDNGGATTPLPLPVDTGDDLVMFIFGTQPMRRP